MSDKHAVYSRSIKNVRSAHINIISPQHQNSFILENGQFEENDPFLFLAEDWFERGSFGVHPHRGIETVTYVMEGKLEHYDNTSQGIDELLPGDAQWMTAGRGVIHKEDPAEGERVHSLQLWVNLPSQHKMTPRAIRIYGVPVCRPVPRKVLLFGYSPVPQVRLRLQRRTMFQSRW